MSATLPSAAAGEPAGVFETGHSARDLKRRAVRGGVVTLSAQWSKFCLQIGGTALLARLLTPADFGLVAMVAAITGFLTFFKDAGLSQATIQRPVITEQQISTLFWVNAALSVSLMLLTGALAPALAWFYSEPRLTGITLATAATLCVGGLAVQHEALLKRQMRYGSLAVRDVLAACLGIGAAVAVAVLGGGYWALVVLAGTTTASETLFTWVMARWVPGRPRRDPAVRSMLIFGGNVTGSHLLNYVFRNADNVLIGWYWGAGALGLYASAYRLFILPLRQLNAPINAVAVPAFSRLHGDPERYAHYYLRTVNAIMWMSTPFMGFLFLGAEPIIVLILGPRWRDAAGVFQILAICAITQPLYNTTGWLFVSSGRPNRQLKLSFVITPLTVLSFVIGLPFGIRGVALSFSLFLLAILPWTFRYTFHGTALTLTRFWRALRWPLSICLTAVAITALVVRLVNPQGDVTRLLTVVVGLGATYMLAAVAIPPARREVLRLKRLLDDLKVPRHRFV